MDSRFKKTSFTLPFLLSFHLLILHHTVVSLSHCSRCFQPANKHTYPPPPPPQTRCPVSLPLHLNCCDRTSHSCTNRSIALPTQSIGDCRRSRVERHLDIAPSSFAPGISVHEVSNNTTEPAKKTRDTMASKYYEPSYSSGSSAEKVYYDPRRGTPNPSSSGRSESRATTNDRSAERKETPARKATPKRPVEVHHHQKASEEPRRPNNTAAGKWR